MMPIAPLMIEHRLIERMIDVMKEQFLLIKNLIHEKYRNMVIAAEKILRTKGLQKWQGLG